MFKSSLEKKTLLALVIIIAIWGLGVYTEGKSILLLSVIGLAAALAGKTWMVIATMVLTITCTLLNPFVLPRDEYFGVISKASLLIVPCAMFVGGKLSKGEERLPLSTIMFFLVGAFLSSMNGWVPVISYLKIVNFGVFMIGLVAVSRCLNGCADDIFLARTFYLAMALVFIYGSLVSLAFPGVAYFTSLQSVASSEGLVYAEDAYYNMADDGIALFSGITIHSQFLGPALVCIAGLVLADALLVEKRLTRLHLAVLLPMPVMLFMTRARVGVFAFAVLGAIVFFYMMPKAQLDEKTRRNLKNAIFALAFVLLAICAYYEYKNQSISRLVRKTNDMTDTRSLAEATTSSRVGLIAESMKDFKERPLLGKGFQVAEQLLSKRMTHWKDYFSAAIEKGLLPTMLLGEVGLLGTALFLYFLWRFFAECRKRQYIATASLMMVFLATNIGEATFFSPGGGGGFHWIFCVLGGFVVDMAVKAGGNAAGMAAVGGPSVKVGIARTCVRKDIKRTRIEI